MQVADISSQTQDRLLRSVAEQLKVPLIQIAQAAELGRYGIEMDFRHISQVADIALRLVDGFLLNADLHGQQTLQIEPICVSAVLQDVAHRLTPHAALYNCSMQMHISRHIDLVMTHRPSLESILTMLGYSLIEGMPKSDKPATILLGAHKSKDGITTGIFTNRRSISAVEYKRARTLFGSSPQPFASLSSSAAAGIFVADSLSARLSSALKVARHNKINGLALTLQPSQQMQLV